MKTARPLPDDFRTRPFTSAEAAEAGVSLKRLRHRSLAKLGRGIRSLAPTPELPLSVRVRPFLEVNERCAASHLTAAELALLPVRRQKEGPRMYHVIRPEGAAHLNRPHVIVHRMKLYDDEITLLEGVPVTTPGRTWLDLAEMLTVDELVMAGDSCVRVPRRELEGRDMPFCSLGDLQRMIDRHKGERGVRKAREALNLIRVGSDSPQESLLRLAIVRAGLPEPELNVPIIDDDGGRHHEPDLSYCKYRIGSDTRESTTETRPRLSGTLPVPSGTRPSAGPRSGSPSATCTMTPRPRWPKSGPRCSRPAGARALYQRLLRNGLFVGSKGP